MMVRHILRMRSGDVPELSALTPLDSGAYDHMHLDEAGRSLQPY